MKPFQLLIKKTMVTDLEFQTIKSNMGEFCQAKVPGGWIILSQQDVMHFTVDRGSQSGYDWRTAICFVPDQALPRKCKFSVYDAEMQGPVQSRYAEKEGLFHRWGSEVLETPDTIAQGSVAIVEDETGQMHMISPHRIKFIDTQK